MKYIKICYVVFFILFLPLINSAQTGWIQTEINPYWGYSLYMTDTEIYAATMNGVYSTTDNGMPWISKGPPGHYVYDIIKSNQNLLVATIEGVYRSSDDGITWQASSGSPTFLGSGEGISGPHLFAKNSSYVFAMAFNRGIFRSGDDGETWQQVRVETHEASNIDIGEMATFIGSAGEKIFICISGVLFFTVDNGSNWNSMQLIRSDGRTDDIMCIYKDNDKLFFGGRLGVYLSTDSGSSWTTQFSSTINEQGKVIGLALFRDIVSYNHVLIAASDFSSIQISYDNGVSWTSFNDGLMSDWAFSALAIKPPFIWTIRYALGNVYRRSLAEIITEIKNNTDLPNEYSLGQNYPNPFNPNTTINFSVPTLCFVTLKIYDMLGREIKTLINEEKAVGDYNVKFDGSDFTSGIYFYQLLADGYSDTKKLTLMK